nr:hypothetical protein LTR18_007687 [Exophiala xenobiotica]
MGDPISATASVITVTTLGLQSVKYIHDSLSQLCNAEKEFARTDESLQSLTGILEQIRELATNVDPPTEASEIDLQQNNNENAWLQKTLQAVKRCTEDLKIVSGNLQRLRSKSGDEKWTHKVTRAVKLFVKNKDLVTIREILSSHIMTDDVVKLLQSILEEISPTNSRPPVYPHKRKRDSVPLNGAEPRSTELQDLRIIKRMRGMLESTQSIAVRDSNWKRNQIPVGHRLERQSPVVQTTVGSVAINAMAHAPTNSRADTDEETIAECFSGTLTLISEKALNQMKLRAFFTQKVLRNGTFSLSPVLSFHAMVPNNSLVFKLVHQGDVKRLVQELQAGSVSLTDCDSNGLSLLGVSIATFYER